MQWLDTANGFSKLELSTRDWLLLKIKPEVDLSYEVIMFGANINL